MVVSTTGSSASYLGNGSTTSFSFLFALPGGLTTAQIAADMLVTYTDASGATHTVVYGTGPNNYQLTVNPPIPPNPTSYGGTIVYAPGGSPMPTGTSLLIQRFLPEIQAASLTNQGTLWQPVI